MSFVSLQFLIFFVIVTSLYFIFPHKFRTIFLLTASSIFYMAFIPQYVLILFFLIMVDYIAGILIQGSRGQRRKIYLLISIVTTCAILFVFKYFNFFVDNYIWVAKTLHLENTISYLDIILPLGLSFHTFQSLAYVIEVYRGKQKAEKNLATYALYVMFYPQLVAGPIERPQNLLHQFYQKHKFVYERVISGLRLMLWGVFMKVVIADRMAIIVNNVYQDPTKHQGIVLILATMAFAFQIFCDFAGYSNIAIGAARVMGFSLMRNFNNPYISKSVAEFWTRWHISLCTWFRDYMYIPLGGNRVGVPRWSLNIMVVFLLSGLWHGASWTFVIWGTLNGVYILFHHLTKGFFVKIADLFGLSAHTKITGVIQTLITFSLITFSWIFFRAQSLADALYISSHLFTNLGNDLLSLKNFDFGAVILHITQQKIVLGISSMDLTLVIIATVIMQFVHLKQETQSIQKTFTSKPLLIRWSFYYACLFLIAYYVTTRQEQFLYFQF